MNRTAGLILSLSLTAAASAFAVEPRPVQKTATPVKHLVVIFQENVSFDHYFATYPHALNLPGETPFAPLPGTPTINGLTEDLLLHNPNSAPPRRLSPAQAATCDQDHNYTNEQKAFDGGLMDKFVEFTGNKDDGCDPKIVVDYFDGNTVTALWNYAQNFAMSDDSFGTTFGPSSVGAINLVSGQTHGAVLVSTGTDTDPLVADGTLIDDPDPLYDDCSQAKEGIVGMTGTNVGDLLTRASVTWGWFEGGFAPTSRAPDGKAVCGAKHRGADGKDKKDYIPHHEPFEYYEATSNPHHLEPAPSDALGGPGRANHQYDLALFEDAIKHGRPIPAVSFIKAPGYQDGHAGYSDPVTEQKFLADFVNRLERSKDWKDMAIVISYDDSDGWYDHVMPPIVNRSGVAGTDALLGPGLCGTPAPGAYPARCGYGPRLPLLVISPYAKRNFVDHGVTDQSSMIRFVEDNWGVGRVGDQSFDEKAGSLLPLFDFERAAKAPPLFLGPDGRPEK